MLGRMAGPEKRREARHRVEVPVAILRGKDSTPAKATDVSYRGAFLRAERPPALRSLVRLRFSLPLGTEVLVHGMVVHVRNPSHESELAGVGIQFMALEGPHKKAWDDFIGELQRGAPTSIRRALVPDAAASPLGTPTPTNPISVQRPTTVLFFRPGTQQELDAVHSREMSRGALTVRTDNEIAVMTPVKVTLLHPRTGDAFVVEGVVRRRVLQPSFKGLGLELTGMDPSRMRALAAFVAGEMPELGDDEIEVEIVSA